MKIYVMDYNDEVIGSFDFDDCDLELDGNDTITVNLPGILVKKRAVVNTVLGTNSTIDKPLFKSVRKDGGKLVEEGDQLHVSFDVSFTLNDCRGFWTNVF